MKASLLFAGMMLAGMTFAVHAAKPETTPEQRKAKAEAMAKKAAAFKASQPQTASQALRTQRTIPRRDHASYAPDPSASQRYVATKSVHAAPSDDVSSL